MLFRSHMDNAPVYHAVTAIHHNALKDELIAVETHNIPGQRTGTSTNDSAAAGKVGEYIESVTTFTNAGASTVFSDLTSISLTAGDWDVTMVFEGNRNGATWSDSNAFIGTIAGNDGSQRVGGSNLVELSFANSSTTPNTTMGTIAGYRMSLSSTTTVYFKVQFVYSAGTPQARGRLSARRIR